LGEVRGIAAVSERRPLGGKYARRAEHPELCRELEARFDLERHAFNSGLLAFSTDVIRDDTCARLRELFLRYSPLQAHPFGDQPALNLHFYRRWKRLPDFYAAIRDHSAKYFFLPEDGLRMIGKHFAGPPRPWEADHPLHAEWARNLARFASLDARMPQPPRQRWGALRIRGYWAWLHLRRLVLRALQLLDGVRARVRRSSPAKRARWLANRIRPTR
jgi:lipopolysaccharide biosynthesis glycosyltransferase